MTKLSTGARAALLSAAPRRGARVTATAAEKRELVEAGLVGTLGLTEKGLRTRSLVLDEALDEAF